MARLKTLLAALSLLLFVGCGGGTTPTASTSPNPTPGAAGAATATRSAAAPKPANPKLILATTTSTVDSGLLDALLPVFERQSGYTVVPLSLGSGQALATAQRGEADVLLVHSPDAEKRFMDGGHGVDRRLVMHNDFVLIGPESDPAGIRSLKRATEALGRIAATQSPFVSRSDQSGTNALELKLWKAAQLDPKGQGWYTEAGTGMGQTLQIANERRAYTISDRATFLAQRKNLQMTVLLERDPALLNIYHVIRVNPAKSDKLNVAGAQAFADFMVSPDTQRLIGDFGKDKVGEPLFFPDAGKDEASLGS